MIHNIRLESNQHDFLTSFIKSSYKKDTIGLSVWYDVENGWEKIPM